MSASRHRFKKGSSSHVGTMTFGLRGTLHVPQPSPLVVRRKTTTRCCYCTARAHFGCILAFLACEEAKFHLSECSQLFRRIYRAVRGLLTSSCAVAVGPQFPRPWRRRGFINTVPKQPQPRDFVTPSGGCQHRDRWQQLISNDPGSRSMIRCRSDPPR